MVHRQRWHRITVQCSLRVVVAGIAASNPSRAFSCFAPRLSPPTCWAREEHNARAACIGHTLPHRRHDAGGDGGWGAGSFSGSNDRRS